MSKKIVVSSDPKPNPEKLLEMFDKLEAQKAEIRSQMKRGAMTNYHIRALLGRHNPFLEKTIPSGLDGMHKSHAWGCPPLSKTGENSDPMANAKRLLEMFKMLDDQMTDIRSRMERGELNTRHIQALIEHRNPFPENPEISGLEGMNKATAWGVGEKMGKTAAKP